jgi:hypothetical protein
VVVGTNPVSVTLTAAATSTTPITYQWFFNGSNPISGATNASLVISNMQLANAGTYSVTATDSYGGVPSTNATLTVLLVPIMTQQPQSQIVPLGGSATFNASASGTQPLSFRWRRNGATLANITTNSANSSFTTNSVTTNGIYTVVITNLAGFALGGPQQGLSSNAYLFVMAPPSNQTVIAGSDATFSTAPQGAVTQIQYQWQFNGGNLANATNSSLTLPNVQLGAAGNYSVVVSVITNAAVPPATFTANLQVLPPPLRLGSPQLKLDKSFQMVLQGQSNQSYVIEISSNLVNWTSLATLTLTNTQMPFVDSGATNASHRFYRGRKGP